jgi:hypothetical protein
MHNRPVPAYWTAGRIANQVHRTVLGPLGFTRRGSVCQRVDGGLRRTLSVHTRTVAQPRVQLLTEVAVAGLPAPLTDHRCDAVSGSPRTAAGRDWYPLSRSDEDLASELLADAADPIQEFLLRADDLAGFVLWAQEIFLGDGVRGCWGRFRPVLPQGTGPIEAAAFAAAALDDTELVEFLTARVENEQAGEHYFNDFLAEIRQFRPNLDPRHPIVRPVRW